jgi:hypothetical protein
MESRGTGAVFYRPLTPCSRDRCRTWWRDVHVQLAQSQYAKRRFPDLSVVMLSGHGPSYVPHGTHLLMKPYPPQQLLDAVLS